MKHQLLLFFLLMSCTLQAQFVNINNVQTEEDSVALKKLFVSVEILDNIATTTMEMHFYNYGNRILEGELNFPLKEGSTVSAFALDINNEWRDGVVVKKDKAKKVFEEVVRQNVDPAILEKTVGNNFKTRLYPINPKAYKKCKITFEEELPQLDGKFNYQLPLTFESKLKEFKVDVEIINEEINEQLYAPGSLKLDFKRLNRSTIAKLESNDQFLKSKLSLLLPIDQAKKDYLAVKGKLSNDYTFNFNTQPILSPVVKVKPSSMTIYWDVSSLFDDRDIKSELGLLKKYFEWNKNTVVTVKPFNFQVKDQKKFTIKEGNSDKLINYLSSLEYDGGSKLDDTIIDTKDKGESWIFTNGISNLSEAQLFKLNTTLFMISSSQTINANYMSAVANQNNGEFINLNEQTIKSAIKKLTTATIRYLGVEVLEGQVEGLYPSTPQAYQTDLSIAGKVLSKQAKLKVNIGTAQKVLYSEEIIIKQSEKYYPTFERLWAQKQINELSLMPKRYKEQIISLSLKYGIVTDYTSFIVLDNVEDYVRHEIVPPSSLRKEYDKLLALSKTKKKEVYKSRLDRVYEEFQSDIDWWNSVKDMSNYVPPKPKKPVLTNYGESSSNSISDDRTYSEERKLVKGVVLENDNPLPGVSVHLKNTSEGIVTNIDGEFELLVPTNAILTFNYIGFLSTDVDVSENSGEEIIVSLVEDNQALEEVVVVGYGTTRQQQQLAGSVAGVVVVSDEEEVMEFEEESFADREVEDSWGDAEDTDVVMKKKNKKKKVKSKLVPYDSGAEYLQKIQSEDVNKQWSTYLLLKEEYKMSPSFYYDVASYFFTSGKKQEGIQVITNLAELDLESHELLRNLGRKLQSFGCYQESEYIFNKLIELRPFEPQNYRDLAFLYEDEGNYQKALDQLYFIIENEWDSDVNNRFGNIELIILHEMNRLITLHKDQLDITAIDTRFIYSMPLDLRVVIDWDLLDTDIDLWVIDPLGEKCFYSHKNTKIGGRMSQDFTRGYGPEEFRLKYGYNGDFEIKVHYYGNSKQSLFGPVSLRALVYSNYSSKDEDKQELNLQLEGVGKQVYDIGNVSCKVAN
ncbi:VIT domain-containing protein [Flammeovirga sp. SubArs3]|uniref:VIT domain-containing protein n=1 Tax=Flammeovirga sp. SubArs3 TaxID=2995316 RepID=UPI00248AD779|nr:VIT domain-containing protein [Flammeovirga sp. SubArs3]